MTAPQLFKLTIGTNYGVVKIGNFSKSDLKRDYKNKALKFPFETIAKIEPLAKANNIPQGQLIVQAVELLANSQKGE